MINSLRSATIQLNKLNQYMKNNTENLFINIELYIALMDIRDRLKKEIGKYEAEQRKQTSTYAKELEKRRRDYKEIQKKKGKNINESFLDDIYSVWFD
jgi:hypothetical protein